MLLIGWSTDFKANSHSCQGTSSRELLIEKLIFAQLVMKYAEYHENHKFNTVFTRVCHLSLSWGRLIQFTHFQAIYFDSSNIFLPSTTRSSKVACYLSVLWITFLWIVSFPICFPPQRPWFDCANNIWWTVHSVEIFSLLQPPVTSRLLGPNALLRTSYYLSQISVLCYTSDGFATCHKKLPTTSELTEIHTVCLLK
jgi:hypothetical protein